MTMDQTQVNLALYIGETYCEIEARSLDDSTILKKIFFLPQITFKSALSLVKKTLAEKNCSVLNVYIVCRYLERLKSFRLGGSVIQITHKGIENNYTLENSTKQSLAASALIISVDKNYSIDTLDSEIDRIKKINPDANKVVISLDETVVSKELIAQTAQFFSEKQFRVFTNKHPYNLNELRKILLNAGTQGTKDEITEEIKEHFPETQIYFWVNKSFNSNPENYDLYFSSDDFLAATQLSDKITKNIHLDIENWMIIENSIEETWDSPWGKITRPHYKISKCSLNPLTEILVDNNALLQFSKMPAPSEPGPMTAGRGVKSLIIDLFYNDMKTQEVLTELFPQLNNTQVENKISSQFKVLEHAQNINTALYVKPLKQTDIKSFILEVIQFDSERIGCSDKNSSYTGNLSFVMKKTNSYNWTKQIFRKISNSKTSEVHP